MCTITVCRGSECVYHHVFFHCVCVCLCRSNNSNNTEQLVGVDQPWLHNPLWSFLSQPPSLSLRVCVCVCACRHVAHVTSLCTCWHCWLLMWISHTGFKQVTYLFKMFYVNPVLLLLCLILISERMSVNLHSEQLWEDQLLIIQNETVNKDGGPPPPGDSDKISPIGWIYYPLLSLTCDY